MALTQVNIVQPQQKESTLDKILKGVQVAQTAFGMYTDLGRLNEMRKNTKTQEEELAFRKTQLAQAGEMKNKEMELEQQKQVNEKAQTNIKLSNDMRTSINNERRQIATSATAYDKVIKSANLKTGAGDIALMYNVVKILDPQSGVKEGEIQLSKSASPLAQRAYNEFMSIFSSSKGAKLDDATRKTWLDVAKNAFDSEKQSWETTVAGIRKSAAAYGLDDNLTNAAIAFEIDNKSNPLDDKELKSLKIYKQNEPSNYKTFSLPSGKKIQIPLSDKKAIENALKDGLQEE